MDQVTDFLIETESGYKLDHFYCTKENVTYHDLPKLQEIIESRTLAANDALEHGLYAPAVMLVAPKYRASQLVEYCQKGLIDPKKAWKIAREAWLEIDLIHENIEAWQRFFALELPCKEYFMNEKERHHLSLMPDQIHIFRGYNRKYSKYGISWSLSKLIASQYAYKCKEVKIAQSTINKSDVIGYINSRGHHEIVVKSSFCLANHRAINTYRPHNRLNFKSIKVAPAVYSSIEINEVAPELVL